MNDVMARVAWLWNGMWRGFERGGEKFLFLGPRASGKTVFFVCAARMLQFHLQKNGDGARFSEGDETSRAYVHAALEKMKNGKWPDKTQFGHEISCDVKIPRRPIPVLPPVFDEEMVLTCVDYPGDAWTYAFHRRGDDPAIGQYADELKEHVVKADGIFLLIDSVILHDIHNSRREDDEWDHFSASLFGMAKELAEMSRKRRVRVAVVFGKRDRFDGISFDPEEAFRKVAPGAYDNIRLLDSRCFFVSSVGRTVTDSKGEAVPPPGFCPEADENPSLLEPLAWMLRLGPKETGR